MEQPSRQFLRSLDVQARIQTANIDPSSPEKVSPVASQKPSFLVLGGLTQVGMRYAAMLLLPSGGYDMYDGNIWHLDTTGCHLVSLFSFKSCFFLGGSLRKRKAAKTCESPTRVPLRAPSSKGSCKKMVFISAATLLT